MTEKLIDLVAGARPNFMKISPIIKALEDARASGSRLRFRLVHTGQHYDRTMSGSFFEQLGIPDPEVNLSVGSGTQAEQTGQIMLGYERTILARRPDACLVVGDVTSTMACAIVARKAGVRVAHVEGGLRSGDWDMPEEVNRVVTDAVANWFFTTSESAGAHLRREGVSDDRIFFVGNVMIDTLRANQSRFSPPDFWNDLSLRERQYFVVTLHRPANVDSADNLAELLEVIADGTTGRPVVFPVHPRTANSLRDAYSAPQNFFFVEPLGYLQFNYLVERALAVLTDSGGVTEETTVLGVPCLTLRDNTERPETVTIGTNELVGSNPQNLARALSRVSEGRWKKGRIPQHWDGRSAVRIVSHLDNLLT